MIFTFFVAVAFSLHITSAHDVSDAALAHRLSQLVLGKCGEILFFFNFLSIVSFEIQNRQLWERERGGWEVDRWERETHCHRCYFNGICEICILNSELEVDSSQERIRVIIAFAHFFVSDFSLRLPVLNSAQRGQSWYIDWWIFFLKITEPWYLVALFSFWELLL